MATTTQRSNFDRLKQSGKKWRATGKRDPKRNGPRSSIGHRIGAAPWLTTSARCWLAETTGRTSSRQWPK